MQAREWTEGELQRLCDNQEEESLTLEFKASEALALDHKDSRRREQIRDELSKDVSAMANAAGGTIIYGIRERRGRGGKGIADSLDGGLDPNVITKERLEDVLTSNIKPTLDGLRIKPVPLDTHKPGVVAYVLTIPQSLRAPHQARDKRFYKRFNFKSEPMEEYEIRALYFRTLAPDLELTLESKTLPFAQSFLPQSQGDQYGPYDLQPVVTNHGHGAAEYAQYQYFVPDKALTLKVTGLIAARGLIAMKQEVRVLWRNGHEWATSLFEERLMRGEFPIFPGEMRHLDAFQIRFRDFRAQGPCMLLWRVRANNMRPRFGALKITRSYQVWLVEPLTEGQVADEIAVERIA